MAMPNPINPTTFASGTDPTSIVQSLYQKYLGRTADPSGLQNALNAYYSGYNTPAAGYANTPLGQLDSGAASVANMLFQSPEGQAYATKMGWNAGPTGQTTVATLVPGVGAMPATTQAVAAASTPGGPPVDATTGQPIGGTPSSDASSSASSGTGGFDLATALSQLSQFAPGGSQSFTPQSANISDWMTTMSKYLQPPTPNIPTLSFGQGGSGSGGSGGSTPPSAPQFGYNTSAWGGLPPSYTATGGT